MNKAENIPQEEHNNWEAPTEQVKTPEQYNPISERVNQTYSSRLCEYVTGMKPENPELINRLEEDQKIIRSKYNLPNPDLPASEFERSLKEIAKNNGIEIRSKHEYSRLFDENPSVGAMSLDGGKVVVDLDRNSEKGYNKSLKQMEHEIIHGLQEKYAKSMPVEEMEYEAYLSNGNIQFLKDDPEAINEIFFGTLIGGSVKVYYDLESERRGETYSPVWDNPNYFIEKDAQAKTNQKKLRAEQDLKQIEEIRSKLGITKPASEGQ